MRTLINYLLILIATNALVAQNSDEAFNDRIRSLLNTRNYSEALNETWRYLEKDPFNVLARSWQTYIYLSRDDSLQKAKISADILAEDPKYNFHLVLENIDFLRNADPKKEIVHQIWSKTLQTYDELFGDLKIYIINAPTIGYYRAKINLKIDTTSILAEIQKKRLEEINSYFKHVGKVYFNEYDQDKKLFYYILKGVPKAVEYHGGFIYTVYGDTDSTFFEFNTEYQEDIEIDAKKFSEFEYILPKDYVLLFFPKNIRVITPPNPEKKIFNRLYHDKQAVLIAGEYAKDIRLETKTPIWQRYIIWGGMVSIFYWLFSTTR